MRTSSLLALALVGTTVLIPTTASGSSLPTTAPELPHPTEAVVAIAAGTASGAGSFAGRTAGQAVALSGTAASGAAALATGAARQAVDVVAPVLHEKADEALAAADGLLAGTAQVCPGVPSETGLSLRPGDLLSLRVALRSPQAAVDTAGQVVDGVEVTAPSAAELLEDPVQVTLRPGGATGVGVTMPVVDKVLEGTSVSLPAPSAGPAMGAAGSDVGTAAALLPQIDYGVGMTWTAIRAAATVTTEALGGPLSFRLGDSSGCTTVSYEVVR